MQNEGSRSGYGGNAAVDRSSEAVAADEAPAVEQELLRLMNNERCPEGLQKELWKRIIALRGGAEQVK